MRLDCWPSVRLRWPAARHRPRRRATRSTWACSTTPTAMPWSTASPAPACRRRPSLDVGNSTGALLSYEFHATPNIGLQLTTRLRRLGHGRWRRQPGRRRRAVQGQALQCQRLRQLPLLRAGATRCGPFWALGANFTSFSGIGSYTGQSVDLSNSWSLAAQAGARYAFDRNWSMVFSLGLNWSTERRHARAAAPARRRRPSIPPGRRRPGRRLQLLTWPRRTGPSRRARPRARPTSWSSCSTTSASPTSAATARRSPRRPSTRSPAAACATPASTPRRCARPRAPRC